MKFKKTFLGALILISLIVLFFIFFSIVKINPLVNVPFYAFPHSLTQHHGGIAIEWMDETDNAIYEHHWLRNYWFKGKSSYSLWIRQKDTEISPEEFFNEVKNVMEKYAKTNVSIAFEEIEFSDVPRKGALYFTFYNNNSIAVSPHTYITKDRDFPGSVRIDEEGYWSEILAQP